MSLCLNCNSEILRKRYNKFCNKSCAATYNNKAKPPRSDESKNKTSLAVKRYAESVAKPLLENITIPTKVCKNCSKPFELSQRKGRNKFCSLQCSSIYNGRLKRKSTFPSPEITCQACSAIITGVGKYYCSKACFSASTRKFRASPFIERGECSTRQTLKYYLIRQRGYRCEICKITEWTGSAVPLELDHIDGNAGNNLPSNLRVICPNCHAKLPTSKGKNRGSGRGSRGISLG